MSEASPDGDGFTSTRLRRIHARLAAYDWAWERENAAAIETNWERRRAAKPGLFDGPVLLSHHCAVREDVCEIAFFETRYSRFIALRDAGSPDRAVANAFAAVVPHTADGAVLLGQMGPHTANAGQIYFPCGTPDPDDVREGGVVDLAGSAGREFFEETGLSLPAGAEDEPWTLLRGEGQRAFLRPVRFDASADALLARIARHHARESEPELSNVVAVRRRADIDPARMPGFVRAYLARVFPN